MMTERVAFSAIPVNRPGISLIAIVLLTLTYICRPNEARTFDRNGQQSECMDARLSGRNVSQARPPRRRGVCLAKQ
jgi:hypothetical protein